MSALLIVTLEVPGMTLGPNHTQRQLIHDFKRKMRAASVWVEVREDYDTNAPGAVERP